MFALSSERTGQTGVCLGLRKKLTTMPFELVEGTKGPESQEEKAASNGGWVVKRRMICFVPCGLKRDSWILRETGGFQLKKSKNFSNHQLWAKMSSRVLGAM